MFRAIYKFLEHHDQLYFRWRWILSQEGGEIDQEPSLGRVQPPEAKLLAFLELRTIQRPVVDSDLSRRVESFGHKDRVFEDFRRLDGQPTWFGFGIDLKFPNEHKLSYIDTHPIQKREDFGHTYQRSALLVDALNRFHTNHHRSGILRNVISQRESPRWTDEAISKLILMIFDLHLPTVLQVLFINYMSERTTSSLGTTASNS